MKNIAVDGLTQESLVVLIDTAKTVRKCVHITGISILEEKSFERRKTATYVKTHITLAKHAGK